LSSLVDAVPHDILKVLDWHRHADKGLAEEKLGEAAEWYWTEQLDIEGKAERRSLLDVISGHHSTKGFWRRMLAYADRLSTVAGRFRLVYDYWHAQGLNPFFVRVYGDIKEWGEEERRRVWSRIVGILRENMKRGGHPSEAYKEINELLSEFPADSRFPYTSLKTHHWLTDAIRRNCFFWEEIRRSTLEKRAPSFEELYLVRISMPEVEFHRVKELRVVKELRDGFFDLISEALLRWSPLRVGDDLYLLCMKRAEINEILEILSGRGLGFDVDVFKWSIGRDHEYSLRSVEGWSLSVSHEDFDYVPESYAEYARILDGDYDYVAWVVIRPLDDMIELGERFLEWGEGELERRFGDRRVELHEVVREPAPFLSPDLALAIAEGYERFLEDCEGKIREWDGSAIVKSFGGAFFVCGLIDETEVFNIYWEIASLKSMLHIPVSLSVIVSKPKYPFWRILELSLNGGGLIFVVGEKILRLSDEDVAILREVSRFLRDVSRSQFHEIITKSRRAGLEELKFFIEGKAVDRKIPFNAAKKLCWMIDEFYKKYGDDWRAMIWRALKALAPYTRFDRRGRRGRG